MELGVFIHHSGNIAGDRETLEKKFADVAAMGFPTCQLQISNGKYQIQRKYIAKNAVNHRGQRGSAHGCRLDQAQDSASVFLRQSQHQGGIEHRVAGTVGKGSQKCHHAQWHKLVGQVGKAEKQHGACKTNRQDPEAGLGFQLHNTQ